MSPAAFALASAERHVRNLEAAASPSGIVLLRRPPTYVQAPACCTIQVMEVAVSELRANLSAWLDRARQGEEVVVTERGFPVVRLLGISATARLERLTGEGVVGRPRQGNRPSAVAGGRPRARRSVADLVSEQRR